MEKQIIFTFTDEKGREFSMFGDVEKIKGEITSLQAMNDDELQEEGYVFWGSGGERQSNSEDRFKEAIEAFSYFHDDFNWEEVFNKLPRKKNGTFSKNRVYTLYRGRSFSQLWEDSYGYAAPELRIKLIGDLEAQLMFSWVVEGW